MAETKIQNYYITREQLLTEFDNCSRLGLCTDKMLEYFTLIATKLSAIFTFRNYADQKAVINFAVTEAWLKWDKFDINHSDNIFGLYSFMIKNDMQIHYNQLYKGKKFQISIDALQMPKDN